MEFFSSWTFIILMAVLLVVMTVVGPLVVVLILIRVLRNSRPSNGRASERETSSESD